MKNLRLFLRDKVFDFNSIVSPTSFIIMFFLGSMYTFSQDVPISTHFSNHNTIRFSQIEEELSNQYISSILQDKQGFIWVGTQDGLYRFDGSNTKVYRYNPIRESIPGAWARTIIQDRNGLFWLGINGHGLSSFDSQKNKFKAHSLESDSSSKLKGLVVSQIHNSTSGDIWIRTEHGLFRKNKSKEGFEKIVDNSPSIFVNESSDGKILIAKEDKLFYYDENTNNLILELDNIFIEQLEPINDNQVIFRSKGKVLIYDLEINKLQEIELPEDISLISNYQKNTLYFLGKSKLYKYNLLTDDFQQLQIQGSNLKINDVKTVFIDAEGVMWIGSRKGLYKENKRGDVFKETIPLHARGIIVDSTHIFIGGRKGFYKYAKANKSITPIIENAYILSIYKTKEGFWLGDLDGNLHFIDNKGRIKKFKNIVKKGNSTIHEIYGIAEDANGYLWIGSWVGLHLINKKGELLKTFDLKTRDRNKALNVSKLYIDKKENLWVNTVGNGIYKVPMVSKISAGIENFAYKHFKHIKGDSLSINSNVLYDILEEKDGTLWFGSNYGINKYVEKTETFEALKMDGKPFDYNVMSIKVDKNNLLWISTIRNGLFVHDKTKNQYFNLNQSDGLISNACLFNSSFVHDGMLYFGTEDNMQVINPEKLIYPSVDKAPLILDLNVYGDEETPSTSLLNNQKITLKHNQSNFTVRFQLLDFRFSDKVNYFYKIKEIQEEWRKTTINTANFTNLQPGEYNFLLKATYKSQVPNNLLQSSMTIVIAPPWWGTWWAYVLYFSIATLLTYGFYRFQISRKLAFAENKRLKEVNNLKSSLYTNITHEFRTPLTVILGMVDTLRTNLIKKELLSNAEKPLEMIERNGKNLLQLINEMLDLAKLESGTLEVNMAQADIVAFIKYVGESFQSLAKVSNVDLTIYSEVEELVMDFDDHKVQAILSNLLSNAIKFSQEKGKIIVHINKEVDKNREFLVVKIKDEGIGIAENELQYIFDRFHQIENPNSKTMKGSGLGLALVKDLVALMKGDISVKSAKGKGSEFKLVLPVHRNASRRKNQWVPREDHTPVSKPKIDVLPQFLGSNADLPIALIIEDNSDVAHYLIGCLEHKYRCIHAFDGIAGIEKAFDIIPDIVISDVMMPNMDGFELCSTLKSDERTDHIPVILLTAKVTKKDRLAGLSHGADAYLTKPFEKAELFTRLDQLVLQRKKLLQKLGSSSFSQIMTGKTKDPKTQFLQKLIKIIHEEIDNTSLGSRHLAHKLHLSESQIYRKLKALTNQSTAVFIRSVRLQKANELLQTSNKSISQIAYEVGFNDPSWFSRAFKEEFGYTPSAIHN